MEVCSTGNDGNVRGSHRSVAQAQLFVASMGMSQGRALIPVLVKPQ
jgi:hypothetical protein